MRAVVVDEFGTPEALRVAEVAAPIAGPDEVVVERSLPAETFRGLVARGHRVRVGPFFGSANSIAVTPAGIVGAADTRGRGATAAGE